MGKQKERDRINLVVGAPAPSDHLPHVEKLLIRYAKTTG